VSLPFPPPLRRLCAAAVLGLLASLGCVNNQNGGTTLYVYDQGSSSVLIWNDVNAVAKAASSGGTVANADKQITGSLMPTRLAWGGLAIDTNRNLLYLVSENGTVTVITQVSTHNGALSATTDIYQFTLGLTSEQFANAAFGQAALDLSSNILYVLETTLDGRQTRVWRLPNPNAQGYNSTVTPATSYTTAANNDTWGVGVAAFPGGNVFGLFGNGSVVYDGLLLSYSGARLRFGVGGTFQDTYPDSNIIIGANTGLSSSLTYGSLAYDAQNTVLYVFSQGSSQGQVVAFNKNQFPSSSSQFNVAPAKVFNDASGNVGSLRVLSHPPTTDVLLGASYQTAPSGTDTGNGGNVLLIWSGPNGVAKPTGVPATLPGVTEIRGMAIGGSQ